MSRLELAEFLLKLERHAEDLFPFDKLKRMLFIVDYINENKRMSEIAQQIKAHELIDYYKQEAEKWKNNAFYMQEERDKYIGIYSKEIQSLKSQLETKSKLLAESSERYSEVLGQLEAANKLNDEYLYKLGAKGISDLNVQLSTTKDKLKSTRTSLASARAVIEKLEAELNHSHPDVLEMNEILIEYRKENGK